MLQLDNSFLLKEEYIIHSFNWFVELERTFPHLVISPRENMLNFNLIFDTL